MPENKHRSWRDEATAPHAAAAAPRGEAAPHPGPSAVRVPLEMRAAIVAQARAEDPNESCGLIIGDRPAADGGVATRYEPLRNLAASPFLYEIHPEDLLRLTIETDDDDTVFWAIVHSHTHTQAHPSPTDIRQAFYPDALYILVSLDPREADPVTGAESLRAWRIVDGVVHEVAIREG